MVLKVCATTIWPGVLLLKQADTSASLMVCQMAPKTDLAPILRGVLQAVKASSQAPSLEKILLGQG